jgi:protein-S-isoprenylcysteine O-methyltransferase Ste14
MRPLVFVLPHALPFWAVFVWSFLPEFKIVQRARVDAKKEGSKDAGSIKVIMATNWLAMIIAFPAAWNLSTMIEPRMPVYYFGLVLLVLGSLLRRLCWKTLGEHFTGDVRASAEQPVIQTGPYRFVRHPSYTAGMIMFAGIGFALTNWISVGVMLLTSIFAYGYRVRVEERAMLGEIGAPYAEFMRTRKRFIPFLI